MSIAAVALPIVLDIAVKHGLPFLRTILEREVGAAGGVISDVAETAIKTVANRAGVSVEDLPGAAQAELEAAVIQAESDPEILRIYLQIQQETNRLLLAPMEAGKPTWTWAWLPAWQWFLMFVWGFTWVLVPIANAALKANIPVPSTGDLANLTLAYLALHMGGHTVKDFVSKRWGS